jgi:hypothetical protein
MSKLEDTQPVQPQPAPGVPPAPQKPGLDFKPMVEKASKGDQKLRGGLSSAMILMLQNLYTQAPQGAQPVKPLNNELNSGWGGQGR